MIPYSEIKQRQASSLIRLISYAGSQSRLARALSVNRQTVNGWVSRGRISAVCAIEAEKITGGAITKQELRPDVEKWIEG